MEKPARASKKSKKPSSDDIKRSAKKIIKTAKKGKKAAKKLNMSPAEYIVTVLLLIAIYFVWTYDKYPNNKVSSEYDGPYEVVKVVDGDTIKLDIDGETTTVRLIGIDTPESVHPDQTKNVPEGKLASEHTKDLLGKSDVFIEYGEEPYDRYGRVLAYVYIDDDTMVNAEILNDGYAQVYTIKPNNKYEEYFKQLEDDARTHDRGLWSTGIFD